MNSRAAAAPVILAGCAIALGLLVMIGWHARIALLTQIHPAHTPMVYNTALCFVLCGAATTLLQLRAAFALGAIVLVLAALNGIEIIAGVNLAIDNIIVDHYINTRSQSAGQMAPNTVVCFLLLGGAIITIAAATRKRWCRQVAALLTGITIALASWALAGFVQGVTSAYEWGGMTPMALHTPIGFLFIGASLMTLLWNRQWAAINNSSWKQRDLGIDVKISILISVLVLASSGFVAMWCYEHFNRALVDERLRELTFDARSVGLQFQGLIDKARRDALFRVSTPEVQSYVKAVSEASSQGDGSHVEEWKHDIQKRFEHLMEVNPEYLQLRIIGVEDGGRELVRTERRAGAIVNVTNDQLQRKGDLTYFADSIRVGANETHVSQINLNREHGRIETPHRPVVRVSAPIRTETQGVFGFVIINIDLEAFFAELRDNLPEHRELYIANQDGEFLLHPDPARCFRFEFGTSDRMQDQFAALQAMSGDATLSSLQFSQQTNDGDVVAVGSSRVTFGAENHRSSLLIATSAPFAEIVAATKPLRARAMLISFALVIISTVVATVFAQSLTRPLRKITSVVKALTTGEEHVELPVHAPNEAGELARAFAELIEQRSLAEEGWKESEVQFRMAVESAPNGMIMVDQQGNIILVNRETETLFGYDRDELIGQPIEMLVPDRFRKAHPSQRDEYMQSPERRSMGAGRDLFGRRKDGSEFPVELGLNPIHTRTGVFVLSTVVDISARKRHEERVKQYTVELESKNEELQQFAYIASHDLQEPLRKIQAFGNMLQSTYSSTLGDEGGEYINRMQASAQRMRSLIDDLLSYSRVSTVTRDFAPVDLNRVMQDVLSDLMIRLTETGGKVNVGELPTVHADESQMRQLFQNLIGNALKFHANVVAPVVDVECKSGAYNRLCTILVRDNGIGFDEKYNDRIFAPFQRLHGRSKYEGTGIGLAVCRKIVDRHGGSITATSAPGKGATFSITLPLGNSREGDLRHAA